jgi:uncharacterized Tic20 family protein
MSEQIEAIDTAIVVPKDARNWGMICHLVAFSGFVIPFAHVLGPLIVWAIKKDDHPFIDDQGKEAMNFQLSMTIYSIVAFLLIFVVIGVFLLIALCVFVVVMIIVASIKANEGVYYRYPLTIRFFK